MAYVSVTKKRRYAF